MTKTITYEDFQESLENGTMTEFFDAEFYFDEMLVFQHPKEINKQSGFFVFMTNYIQNKLSKKLNLKGDDIASDKFFINGDAFFYNKKLILSCTRKEYAGNVIYSYIYYGLKN